MLVRYWLMAGAGVLFLGVGAPALADVKGGVDAWTRGDFNAAVAEWVGPAASGDADAQFNLAQAYKLGRGVKQDLTRAEDLFGQAAARGHLHASDNFGLLLFQRGERARALPYITAAADRGEPRAQYLLGIASFNGDNVAKDWVRAYALVSLAQQAGLPQAAAALAQMDQYVPVEQRQKSVALAQELGAQAETTRARQLASADLGASLPIQPSAPVVTAGPGMPPVIAAAAPPPPGSPRDAGADYARPRTPVPPASRPATPPAATAPVASPPRPAAVAVAVSPRAPAPRPVAVATSAATPGSGTWRVQLGAFGVPANAAAMWERVKARPEIAGHARLLVPAGRVTKLQAGGYASESAAQAACARLAVGGITCMATRN